MTLTVPRADVMPWGRYRGELVAELPDHYLQWLATECRDADLRRKAVDALRAAEVDEPDDGEREPDPTSAAVALPGIAFRWWAAMRDEFADDPAAMAVADRGLERLKEFCTAFTGKPWPKGGP